MERGVYFVEMCVDGLDVGVNGSGPRACGSGVGVSGWMLCVH